MSVDTFLIRIVLLVIPGLAGYKTFRTIQSTGKSRKKIKDWQDFLAIVFLSVVAYGLLYLLYCLIVFLGRQLGNQSMVLAVTSIDALVNEKASLNFFEILYASMISMVVGLVSAVLYNKKTVFRVARSLNITSHYGDDDVWSYVTNSDDVEWLFVRDHRVGLVYYGRLSVFSESDEKRELLLEDVDVYSNADGTRLYHTDSLYICRKDDELTLEVPKQVGYIESKTEEKDVGSSPKAAAAADSRRNRKKGRNKAGG